MKVMIVGGAGYIGSSLVPALLQANHEVVVADLMWFGEHLPRQAKVWKGDARDLIVRDLVGIDVVVFLAGLSNDPMADFDPLLNFELNASLPAYLAHIAKQAGVKK